jgi:hypothetical protein
VVVEGFARNPTAGAALLVAISPPHALTCSPTAGLSFTALRVSGKVTARTGGAAAAASGTAHLQA